MMATAFHVSYLGVFENVAEHHSCLGLLNRKMLASSFFTE